MRRGEKVAYSILIGLPILFILFLLAIVNVLFLLLGIIILLLILVILKELKPEWFSGKKPPQPETIDRFPPVPVPADKPKVYMVLTGREDFGARRISVNKTSYSIGRSRDNDFALEGGQISRHHLRIEYNSVEGVCYAVDSSANGTYLNNERMLSGQRYKLNQGDYLMIDGRRFVVEYANY